MEREKNDKPLFSQSFEATENAEIGDISAEMGKVDTDKQVLEQKVKGKNIKVEKASVKTGDVKSRPAYVLAITAIGVIILGLAGYYFNARLEGEMADPIEVYEDKLPETVIDDLDKALEDQDNNTTIEGDNIVEDSTNIK